jgi:hypothetical protein
MNSLYFTYKYISKHTYNIILYKNHLNLGISSFSLHNNLAIINNIEIKSKYRNNNYGSMLLHNIEHNIKKIPNIKKITLLAWQPSGSTNVIDFFIKNQYININNHHDDIITYDNSVIIYDLHKFHKLL